MTPFKSINPYNRELVVERPLHKKREWLGLLNKAHEGFLEWRLLSLDQRVDELQKVRAKLLERKEELAQMATVEMGKPIHEARAEIQKCVVSMEQLFELAPKALATKTITADYSLSEVSYEGMGAILGIMPWNYPYWQVIRFAIPTLLAGNAVLLKHAPNVPGCSMLLEAVFQQSSRLGKVYNALYTDSKTTLKIIQKPEIRGVSFTGSTETGRIIAKKCGGALKPIVMELGGSNAFLVFEDSDLEFSAKMAVSSRFANNGQSCIASKRFIVDSRIHDEFRNLVAIEMMRIQVGDPSDESVSLGPLAREDLAAKVEKQVAKSVQKGAKIMMGGTRDFCLFSPTLLSDVKPGMPCFDEEVFGPVVSIIPADTEDEMIRLANATDFGLGVVLLSGDPDRLRNRIPEFMDGAVFVNTPVKSDARLPFGGSKNSGIGRELGEEGLRSFTNVKTTVIEKQP